MSRKSEKEFLIRVRADINKALSDLKKVSGGMKKAGDSGKKASSGVSKFEKSMNSLILVAKVYIALKVTRQLILQADAFQVLQTRIKSATKETGDYVAVSKQVFDISQRNGTALKTTTSLFQSIARAAPELKATNQEVLGVVDSVSQLGVISGTAKANLDAGLLQFSQGLSSGVFRAEEFNSLLENIPEVAKRIAQGMGKTTGELRKAIIAGDVLSKDVFESLKKQAGEIAAEFEEIPDSVTRNETKIVTSFSRALDAIDSKLHLTDIYKFLLSAGTYLLDGVSNSINELSTNELNEQVDESIFHVQDLIQEFDNLSSVDFNNAFDLVDQQLVELQKRLKEIKTATPYINILPDEQEKIDALLVRVKKLVELRKILKDGAVNPNDKPDDLSVEADKNTKSIEKIIEALHAQVDTLGLTNDQMAIYQLSLKGASIDELALAAALVKRITAFKESNELQKEVNKIYQATRTDAEKLAAEMKRLNELYASGKLDLDVYKRAVDQVEKKLNDLGDSDVWKKLKDSVKGWGQETADALAEMTVTGEDLWRELADSIIQQILRIVYYQSLIQPLLAPFNLGGTGASNPLGGGGIYGGASAGQTAHTGGIIGMGGVQRSFPSAIFTGAPRYHGGGIAGLRPNEIPTVLEMGEEVLTANNPRHRNNIGGGSGGSGGDVVVKVENKGGEKQAADVNVNRQGQDLVVSVMLEDVQNGGPISRNYQKKFNLSRNGR